MRFYKARLDTKGRISLPIWIRSAVDMKRGDELILETAGRNELIISPLAMKEGNLNIEISFTDFSKGLAKMIKKLYDLRVDILKSESHIKGNFVRWKAVAYSENDAEAIARGLKDIEHVHRVSVTFC